MPELLPYQEMLRIPEEPALLLFLPGMLEELYQAPWRLHPPGE